MRSQNENPCVSGSFLTLFDLLSLSAPNQQLLLYNLPRKPVFTGPYFQYIGSCREML